MAHAGSDEAGSEVFGKANAILAALSSAPCLSVAELADAVGEPTSSTYRLLQSLTALGWVDAAPRRGDYRLGLGLLSIGAAVETSLDVRQLALPRMRELRAATDLAVLLCYRRGRYAVCVERLDGHAVSSVAMQVADSLPLHRGAAPLVLLAHLPEGEREAVLHQLADPERSAPYPPAAPEELGPLLRRVRAEGVARSDQDVTPGIAAIGSPVRNHRGETIAALSVSGLREHVLDREDEVTRAVLTAARDVSTDLGSSAIEEDADA